MVDDKKDSWHLSIISENISTENVLLEELEFKNWKNSSIISRKFYIKYKFWLEIEGVFPFAFHSSTVEQLVGNRWDVWWLSHWKENSPQVCRWEFLRKPSSPLFWQSFQVAIIFLVKTLLQLDLTPNLFYSMALNLGFQKPFCQSLLIKRHWELLFQWWIKMFGADSM